MKEEVLKILEEICGDEVVREELDLNLFDAGLLDSLGVIELLIKLEQEMNIVIEPTEVNREEIDTPNKLISYLEMRK